MSVAPYACPHREEIPFWQILTLCRLFATPPSDGTNTHMWHTLPMCITIANVMVLALFGTIGDDKSLDSANSFFTFLYGVEIGMPIPKTATLCLREQFRLKQRVVVCATGAKMFALRPGRFFRSSSNKIDFVLVVAAIIAQIMTVILIFEHKSFWRCWASVPLLRLFILTPALRKTMAECRRAIVQLMPGFVVPGLLFYLGAIGGMQLFHGKVHTESGYPVRLILTWAFTLSLLVLCALSRPKLLFHLGFNRSDKPH